jgi:hypothetical protein
MVTRDFLADVSVGGLSLELDASLVLDATSGGYLPLILVAQLGQLICEILKFQGRGSRYGQTCADLETYSTEFPASQNLQRHCRNRSVWVI